MKRLVSDLIQQKGLGTYRSVTPRTSISEALETMFEENCSAILVMDQGKLKGIFSEKDFAWAAIIRNSKLTDPVSTAMTSKIYYAEPTFTLEECLQMMFKVHVRHLPVLDGEKPLALLSMRHIMEVLVDEKETHIRQLTSYITGNAASEPFKYQTYKSKVPVYLANQKQEAV